MPPPGAIEPLILRTLARGPEAPCRLRSCVPMLPAYPRPCMVQAQKPLKMQTSALPSKSDTSRPLRQGKRGGAARVEQLVVHTRHGSEREVIPEEAAEAEVVSVAVEAGASGGGAAAGRWLEAEVRRLAAELSNARAELQTERRARAQAETLLRQVMKLAAPDDNDA